MRWLFVGALFSRVESVSADTSNGVPTAVVTQPERWTRTVTWGVNLSEKAVTDLLKG